MNESTIHLRSCIRQVQPCTHILLPSLCTHQGRDGPEGTIRSTRTQRTYRKTWKKRQTSKTLVFPFPVTCGICVVCACVIPGTLSLEEQTEAPHTRVQAMQELKPQLQGWNLICSIQLSALATWGKSYFSWLGNELIE